MLCVMASPGKGLCAPASACGVTAVGGNSDAKRLYDDLMSNYNRLIRPVKDHGEKVTVKLGVRLTQIIEIVSKVIKNLEGMTISTNLALRQDLKDQILKTNLWMEHVSVMFCHEKLAA